jgi:protein-disulfide isomerase
MTSATGMRKAPAHGAAWLLGCVLLAASACGGGPLAPERSQARAAGGAIPIAADEVVLGDPDALVTVVTFIDYASPSAAQTVEELERARRARPDDVRYVLAAYPSCARPGSHAAANAAEAVLALRGSDALGRFQEQLLAHPSRLGRAFIERAALEVGVLPAELPLLDDPRFAARVERQIVLARRLGVDAAPTSFVNGFELRGVPDAERLGARIEAELQAASALEQRGRSAADVYAERVELNRRAAAERAPRASGLERVPVAGSAARGLPDARLTVVELASFTNGCSKAAQASLERLEAAYGARLRRVFKHAAPAGAAREAANFAEYARAVGGDARFFQAARLLWQSSPELSPATLERLARVLGLDPQGALLAVATDQFAERIDADRLLASDLGLEREPSGDGIAEPVLFVNGQRVPVGASDESLRALVEERLAQAEARLRAGTPASALYDALLESAPGAPVPALPRELEAERLPYRGARGAPVQVEMFASYSEAACSIPDALQRLFLEYPGRIQLSFRPLATRADERERLATEAALEAHAQLGNAGFWHMARLLCSGARPLSSSVLEGYAEQARLDLARFRSALEAKRYQAAIDASEDRAARWGFAEGPSFVINGEPLRGESLRARVQRSLGGAP